MDLGIRVSRKEPDTISHVSDIRVVEMVEINCAWVGAGTARRVKVTGNLPPKLNNAL